jgi:hypothetical protein
MQRIKDKTIKRLVKEHLTYKPTYRTIGGLLYERAPRNSSLVPPRIMRYITNSGNTLEWKVKQLNERELHYRKVIKAQSSKIYPYWDICEVCNKYVALITSKKCNPRCVECKFSRAL